MLDRTQPYDDDNDVDRDALERAMEIAQRDPLRASQLDAMLRDRPWHEVAQHAAYCCQNRNLRLTPWEDPPLTAPPGTPGARLLGRMLSNGVSAFEPDPLGALGRANPPVPFKAPTTTAATRRKAKQRSRERKGLVTLRVAINEAGLLAALTEAHLLDPLVDHDKVAIEAAVERLLELIMTE